MPSAFGRPYIIKYITHYKRVPSLALDVAPLTGKIIKNPLNVFESGESVLQNGILHFVFR